MLTCYRCGSCCHEMVAMVPKDESSNLSPDFLANLEKSHGFDYVDEYIDNNSVLQGMRCQWLRDEPDGTTTCLVYEKRSSDCRNYPDPTITSFCRVGKLKMTGEL